MLSQQELYNEAVRKISARRQMARTRAASLQAELEAVLPAFAAAQAAIRDCGIHVAMMAATGQDTTDARTKLAEANQHLEDILAQSGRAPDCLTPKFGCPLCQDTGNHDGAVCKCVRTLMRSMRRAEIEANSSLSISKFESMDCKYYPNTIDTVTGQNVRQYMQLLLCDLQEYAEDFDHQSANLLLFGNSGLGKTHAALAIAGIVLEKGYDVIYTSTPDFFSQLESYHFSGQSELENALLEAATNADLLILDDLGTEMVSSFMISTLYTLLNHRTATHRPMIFTSNIIDGAMFEKRYTEKIASRLSGNCEPFHFIGVDIRELKAQE